jgi:photosynthetic reaction center cytochrome c subunit
MNLIPKWSACATTAVILGISLTIGLGQKPVAAQGAAAGSDAKMEDVFKNIKAFRGLPAEQLNPTMVFFEASLGVGCPYCHDDDAAKRELDTKNQKIIARRMIDMVTTINKSTFGGARRVTCFTCHMGRSTPIGVPNVTGEELPVALGEDYPLSRPSPPAVPAVSATQVLDKYFAALGGAAAVQKTPSLTAVGTVTQLRTGRPFPGQQIEISSKPGLELTVTKAGQNDNLLAYGPTGGWAKAGNGAPRDLRKAELDAMMLEDTFNLPAQLKQLLLDPKMERPEVINGGEVYVVTGHTKNLPKVNAYFEKENGMLARLVYYIDTFVGPYPTQIEYRDFRDVAGRKVPYSWVISQTRNREFTYAMQAVRAAAVEDAKFVRPGASSR